MRAHAEVEACTCSCPSMLLIYKAVNVNYIEDNQNNGNRKKKNNKIKDIRLDSYLKHKLLELDFDRSPWSIYKTKIPSELVSLTRGIRIKLGPSQETIL